MTTSYTISQFILSSPSQMSWFFVCVFCYFFCFLLLHGRYNDRYGLGESRVWCWEWKQPKPRSGWCMPRWLGHCVTRGRFQWDFLINQTNCKLLIRYNSSLTPQTLAHRYEKAILRINKNNKCIMLALLFIIVSWKLIFLRWKCLKLRLFFFLIFSICFEKPETL